MPTEILLKIFEYLGPDLPKKALTETCERFERMFSADLKLVVNFDRIHAGEKVPEIKRNYSEIDIIGEEVSPFYLEEILASSAESCERLKISRGSLCTTSPLRIYSRVLFELLKQLPSVKNITMTKVNVIAPQCKFDAVTDNEVPELPMLSVLKIESVEECVFQAFTKSTKIKKITVESTVGTNFMEHCPSFMAMLKAQKKLKDLKSDIFDTYYNARQSFLLPKLEELEFCNPSRFAIRGNKKGNLFIIASPNLKSLSLRFTGIRNNGLARVVFGLPANKSLENIRVDYAQWRQAISRQDLLFKFPSLKQIKNYDAIVWNQN
jgi:hypothetical protein